MTKQGTSRLLALAIGSTVAALIAVAVWWASNPPTQLYEIALRVVDQRGSPVERFGWTVCEVSRSAYTRSGTPEAVHPGGRAIVSVPSDCESLEVDADAYHAARFGPFERGVFPTELDVVLTDLGLIRGVVTHKGSPVVGARVELLAQGLDAAEGVRSGLHYGYHGYRAITDGSGVFAIGSDFPHMAYYARACSDGLAVVVAGPVSAGDPPIVVELSEGGTIEGTLRLQSGADTEGARIMLYRDDFEPEAKSECGHSVATAGADGRFRFEHVARGDWLVKLVPDVERRDAREQVSVEFVPFVVTASDHEMTRLDMDLTQPVAHLDGDLSLNGKSWTKAYVCLRTVGDRALAIDKVPGGNEGRWSVRARMPGKYRLVVQGEHHHSAEPREVSEIVELSFTGLRWVREVNWRKGEPEPAVLKER